MYRKEAPKGWPPQGFRAELGWDFHCHLLPNVDDGMASYEDAVEAIGKLKSLGFRGAVVTPHLYHGVFDNKAVDLRIAFGAFLSRLREDEIAFHLLLAGEYFADEHFLKLVEEGDLLHTPLNGERLVLLEFSYLQETPFASAALAALVAHRYRPVVAHVERYRFVAKTPEPWLEMFARHGAVLQADIGSLAGQHGEDVKKFAHWLLDRQQVRIWGTDIHNPRQIDRHIVPGLALLNHAGRLGGGASPMLMELTT